MIKLSRSFKNFSNERNFSSFFYFILRNLSLFFFTRNNHEISGTKFYNSCKFKKFKEFQLNTSILRINLLFNLLDSPYDSSCNGNGLKKKKFFIFPFPLQVASPCLSHATSNYLVYTPVHSRTKARGGGRREKGRERIDRYSITRSRAVETRGGGRREFKPLWKSSQKLISPFSVQPFSSDPTPPWFSFRPRPPPPSTSDSNKRGCKFIDELATAISPASIRLFH